MIEANKKVVNFLDVTFNLTNGSYMPYNKPNNMPIYIHAKSNHPPHISKNIPEAINRRLSEISSNKESFDRAAPLYQGALEKSGYKHQLQYAAKSKDDNSIRKNKRHRNIIWYNPSYSKNVATNVGKIFLKLIDEEFPKHHILHSIFNRNTVKISYSCMTNIKQNIHGHNKSKLSEETQRTETKLCNCRKPEECPMAQRCLTESVVYKATVSTDDNKPNETYVGLTENAFKTRFTNHKASFRNPSLQSSTELSKYIWELKMKNINFNISWKILKQTASYNPASNRCNLCTWEKYYIICKPELATLNKRNELVSTCRHSRKYLLQNLDDTVK